MVVKGGKGREKRSLLVPLLEPSSPSITLIEEITCCAAGGDMEVA
jgi:hypothetical protein